MRAMVCEENGLGRVINISSLEDKVVDFLPMRERHVLEIFLNLITLP